MASAVDSAIQDASKAIDTSGIGANTAAGLQMGMSLAQRQEDIEAKKQQIQFQQQQQEVQKGDWLHSQMSSITSENDPHIRKQLVDSMAESFPKMFDGKRMDPAQQELLKKSDSWIDKVGALTRIRKAWSSNTPQSVTDLDKEIVNGMSSNDIATNWNHLNSMQSNETAIIKALIAKGIAPQAAASVAGQSPEQMQQTMAQNSPFMARVQSQQTMAAQQAINKDTLMNAYKQRLDGASRVNDLINDAEAGNIKTNGPLLGQLNAEIARLETGSQSPGLTASEKTEYTSAATDFSRLKDKITGKPSDAISPEIIKQIKGTMNSMTDSYMRSIDDRYGTLSSGLTPVQQPVVKAKWDQDKVAYSKRFGHWAGTQPGVSAGGVNPGLAGVSQTNVPKPSQADLDIIDSTAKERLRQARAAQKSGQPITFTEQQVKDTYKNITGKDLVE